MANAGTGCGLGADHAIDAGNGSRRSRSRSREPVRGLGTGFVSELPEFFGVEEVEKPVVRLMGMDIDIDTWVRMPVVVDCPYLAWYHFDNAMARREATRSRTTSVTATTAATASASSSSVENCGFSFIGDIRHSATVSEKTEDTASDWFFLLDL